MCFVGEICPVKLCQEELKKDKISSVTECEFFDWCQQLYRCIMLRVSKREKKLVSVSLIVFLGFCTF